LSSDNARGGIFFQGKLCGPIAARRTARFGLQQWTVSTIRAKVSEVFYATVALQKGVWPMNEQGEGKRLIKTGKSYSLKDE